MDADAGGCSVETGDSDIVQGYATTHPQWPILQLAVLADLQQSIVAVVVVAVPSSRGGPASGRRPP